jgi:hypothetical protein
VKIKKETVHIKSSNKNKSNKFINNNDCLLSVEYVWRHIAKQENTRNIPTAKKLPDNKIRMHIHDNAAYLWA